MNNLQHELLQTDAKYSSDANDTFDNSISRNCSFGNSNYDQILDMYNSNLNRRFSRKKLVGNSQLFNKRVKMFNKNKEANRIERMKNVSRSSRGSMKNIRSMKSLSNKTSPSKTRWMKPITEASSPSKSTKRSSKASLESIKKIISTRRLA
jgi:hypothetical protein